MTLKADSATMIPAANIASVGWKLLVAKANQSGKSNLFISTIQEDPFLALPIKTLKVLQQGIGLGLNFYKVHIDRENQTGGS